MAPGDDPIAGSLFRADVGRGRAARSGSSPAEPHSGWATPIAGNRTGMVPAGIDGATGDVDALAGLGVRGRRGALRVPALLRRLGRLAGHPRRATTARSSCAPHPASVVRPGTELPWEASFCRADARGQGPAGGHGDGGGSGLRRAGRTGWAAAIAAVRRACRSSTADGRAVRHAVRRGVPGQAAQRRPRPTAGRDDRPGCSARLLAAGWSRRPFPRPPCRRTRTTADACAWSRDRPRRAHARGVAWITSPRQPLRRGWWLGERCSASASRCRVRSRAPAHDRRSGREPMTRSATHPTILIETDGRTLATAEVHPTGTTRASSTPTCTSSRGTCRRGPAPASSTRCWRTRRRPRRPPAGDDAARRHRDAGPGPRTLRRGGGARRRGDEARRGPAGAPRDRSR